MCQYLRYLCPLGIKTEEKEPIMLPEIIKISTQNYLFSTHLE